MKLGAAPPAATADAAGGAAATAAAVLAASFAVFVVPPSPELTKPDEAATGIAAIAGSEGKPVGSKRVALRHPRLRLQKDAQEKFKAIFCPKIYSRSPTRLGHTGKGLLLPTAQASSALGREGPCP